MYWYKKCLRHYADFKGRARRREYWLFLVFNSIFAALASILDWLVFGTGTIDLYSAYGQEMADPYPLFASLYSLAMLIPSLAVAVRRLHDVGKSGWWYLILFVPVIGWIWFLILTLTDSAVGANKYGEDPKYKERLLRYGF